MAGSGRKVFTAGEVLRAADVNGYLMDQAVQVYAGTAARGSAIGTATSAGMMSYLSDQAKLQLATGTATWVDVYPQSPFSPNPIINSGFDVWQRGTSSTTTGGYTADRWYCLRGSYVSGATWSQQLAGINGIRYCMRMQRNSGNTSTEYLATEHPLESINSYPFVGETVTYSFYARKGANMSAANSALTVWLASGTGTDQRIISGFTGYNVVASTTANLTTSWQRFTMTGTVPTNATQLSSLYQWIPVGTAGAADYVEITGVQLEIGSATTFRRNGNSIEEELAACQRYYYRKVSDSTYGAFGWGRADGTTSALVQINFPVEMRTVPSSTIDWTGTASNYAVQGANATSMGVSAVRFTKLNAVVYPTVASGLTAGGMVELLANNNTTAYLGFSAEL